MRVLYAPNKIIVACRGCGNTLEYEPDEWRNEERNSIMRTIFVCKVCGHNTLEIVADKKFHLIETTHKCRYCNCDMSEIDKFCNQCGAPK